MALRFLNSGYFAGKVGIGTDSPGAVLSVRNPTAGTSAFSLQHSTTSSIFDFQTGIANVTGDALVIKDVANSYDYLTLRGGNVGIGTSSPSARLQVYDDRDITSNPTNKGIRLQESTGDWLLSLGISSVTNTGFAIRDNVTSAYPFVIRETTGNVGIGTTSPLEKLEVQGTVYATPVAYAASQNAYALKMGAHNNTAFDQGIKIKSSSTGQPYMSFNDRNEDTLVLRGAKVGIGTDNPTQAKLCVSGSTFQTGDLLLSDSNAYSPEIKMTNSTHTIGIDYQSNETLRFITRSGTTTVPITFQMRAGTITAANFILSSDERKKTKIKDLSRDSINVNWKSFEMKENEGEYRAGVIAQELEEKHPEFVRTDDQGMKSVAYIDLLIAKIAELEARLEKAGI